MSGTFGIEVGRRGGEGVSLDALRLVDSRMLIQANSGGGKSWLLRKIAEQTGGRLQTVILDPEGEFATLRERVDFVLVGHGGDVPAHPKMASTLARELCELGTSAVVNLSELKKHDRHLYVKSFLNSLMSTPRRLWHPMLILIDEAHMFCPEKGAGDSVASESVIDLMTRGRKRGYGGILVTQRISKLRKDATAEVNNVCVGRTVQDVDQRRAADALGILLKERTGLRDLKPGEFWAFGPAFNYPGVERFQVGGVTTSHPTAGARHSVKAPAPRRAIQGALGKLEAAMEGVQDDIVDLDAAKKRIAQLEREAKRAVQVNGNGATKEAVRQAVDAALEKAERKWRQTTSRHIAKVQQGLARVKSDMGGAAIRLEDVCSGLDIEVPPTPASPVAGRSNGGLRNAPEPVHRGPSGVTASEDSGDLRLSRCERAILSVLAQFPQGRTRAQAAILSGYSIKSSGYKNAISSLRTKGLIDRAQTDLVITDEGLEAVGGVALLPEGSELAAHWYAKLGKCERAILECLVEAGGFSRTREEIAAATEYSTTSSGFKNSLSKLRTLELISRDAEPCADPLLIDGAA